MRVAGVVLAAGAGRRFGMPKALVEHRGSLLVDRAARVLAEGGCSPVVVVLGAAADEVREQAELAGVSVVVNPDWDSGMGSSLRVGIDALTSTDADAAVVLPVDMPGIGAEAVRRVAELAVPSALAAAAHDGRRSHPVLLGREHWAGARASATGDAGARGYLRDREVVLVPCDDVSAGFDVDRPEDLPADGT
ncbi:nucleotidyltransferase family protein [Saccharopolyspora sp. WRP15-2]|uniref:Nucleotidyltransferase family protein n=1 Tax=Saccharopolyspora oryzae TaxID=2997343 RepID=A0ABT4V5T8_9PSEU|nr:nucleotidyltransferase family protein [Saccharopolyspora oryzae]MDA3629303.1 nucleotidyltransferase family protein [Saccharopolyspora oryzae]